MEDVRYELFNGPEAFTPDNEFILGESDIPDCAWPRASVPTASPAPAESASRWRNGS